MATLADARPTQTIDTGSVNWSATKVDSGTIRLDYRTGTDTLDVPVWLIERCAESLGMVDGQDLEAAQGELNALTAPLRECFTAIDRLSERIPGYDGRKLREMAGAPVPSDYLDSDTLQYESLLYRLVDALTLVTANL